MRAETRVVTVGGVTVNVVRKDIKNLRLAVYPPDGRVRLSVPLHVSDEVARQVITDRLTWIRRHQRRFAGQPSEARCEVVTGETHYVWGRPYRLNVIHHEGRNRMLVRDHATLDVYVRPDADADRRREVLDGWYRAEMKVRVPELIARWEPVIGVEVAAWGVRAMKTRWGSCNIRDRRIWLNLELAKKPPGCLEYVVVHEMVHLLERHHNDRFHAFMDRFLPGWRLHRDVLRQRPPQEAPEC